MTAGRLFAREAAFRLLCRHRQGSRPNILLYCIRRGGSTWALNTVAAHPGLRYVGRPFLTLLQSRWRKHVPDLARAAGYDGPRTLRHIIHFAGDDEARFRAVARNVIEARWHVYPALNMRAPYFNRKTDRVIFQMTSGAPLINWFEANCDVATAVLVRHPIPTSRSIMQAGWEPECFEFLEHRWFVDTHLSGPQVDLARAIEAGEDELARHVLDWCLKMLVPLRQIGTPAAADWLLLSYESLVRRPEEAALRLSAGLDLPDINSMLAQIRRPSRTVSAATRGRVEDPGYLLSRWRKEIGADRDRELMKILTTFDIPTYEAGRDDPVAAVYPEPAP